MTEAMVKQCDWMHIVGKRSYLVFDMESSKWKKTFVKLGLLAGLVIALTEKGT